MGAISIISLVNVILVVILRLLAKFERSHSINSEMKSSTLKIFVATFFNTVIFNYFRVLCYSWPTLISIFQTYDRSLGSQSSLVTTLISKRNGIRRWAPLL